MPKAFSDGIMAAALRLLTMKSGASARFLWSFSFLYPRRKRGGVFSDGIMAAALRLLTIPLLRTGGRGLEAHALPTPAMNDYRIAIVDQPLDLPPEML